MSDTGLDKDSHKNRFAIKSWRFRVLIPSTFAFPLDPDRMDTNNSQQNRSFRSPPKSRCFFGVCAHAE